MAQLLQEHLKVPHLSTGDLFRREIARKTPLGTTVHRYVTEGRLVPDALVVKVMTRQLTARLLKHGFVLDGFPRTVGQAKGLDAFLKRRRAPLCGAIYLACPKAILLMRLTGRRVCGTCGATYHLRNMPSKRTGVCDRCRGRLIVRKDDQPATIAKRLAIHHKEERPLLAHYQRQRLLYRLNGGGSSGQTFPRLVALLTRHGWLVSRHAESHDRA